MLANCACDEFDFFVAVEVARSVEGVKFAIVLKEIDNFYFKASVRTNDCYSACKFCAMLHGGGHEKAAGFEIVGRVVVIKALILKKIKEFLVDRSDLC